MSWIEKIRKVSRAFNDLSKRYEQWYSEESGELIREIEVRAMEKLIPEGTGLEVGVGSGIFASEVGINFGVDPAEKLLLKARSKGVDVTLGIGEILPFKSSSFDFLVFVISLAFLEDPQRSLDEARRVLKEGGAVLVCFVPKESSWGDLYGKKKRKGHDFYKHANFYSNSRIESLIEEAGFRIESAVSTLFQDPGSVVALEEPVEHFDESAGFCCIRAERD